MESKLCVILGAQWGDEGKGKLVDILAEKYDYCARFNGGANAGIYWNLNNNKLKAIQLLRMEKNWYSICFHVDLVILMLKIFWVMVLW